MNNYNYPAGSDNSSAPWNQKEPDCEECPDCEGNGYIIYLFDDGTLEEKEYCTKCEGTGYIEVEPD